MSVYIHPRRLRAHVLLHGGSEQEEIRQLSQCDQAVSKTSGFDVFSGNVLWPRGYWRR